MNNRKGLLLVNLGSPDSSDVSDVKKYLKQFLMDKEVIDVPYFMRYLLVRGFIIPSRVDNSAEAYSKIFTDQGSPLKFITKEFTEALRVSLAGYFSTVDFAMRYGEPSIESKILEFSAKGVEHLTLIPMYPQFAKSSSRTVFTEARRILKKHKISKMSVKTVKDFFMDESYTRSFADAIKEDVEQFKPDHVLLSYHGLPESHVKEFAPKKCFVTPHCCDQLSSQNRLCYRAQCFESSRRIMSHIPETAYTVSFQSRLGRQEWIKPYTDLEIEKLIQEKGVKRLLVACPAFVADCLETLEEIALRLKDDFIAKGGEDLKLVPSLNVRPYWVDRFALYSKQAPVKPLEQIIQEVSGS